MKRFILLIFVSLTFIAGMKFNSLFAKKVLPVPATDISKYEADFSEVSKLLSQNTLAVYGIADALTNSWIKSSALGLDSVNQIEKIFSDLENNGTKASLTEKNAKIEEGVKILKNPPFQYLEAYKVLEEAYTVYSQFYKFTLNPSGSLVIYSKKIAELEADLAKKFSRLNLHAPKGDQNSNRMVAKQDPVPELKIAREPDPLPGRIYAVLGKNIEEVENDGAS
jgi:hypothetical protein